MKVLNELKSFGQQEALAQASAHLGDQGSEEAKEECLRLLDLEVERQLMSAQVKVGHGAGSNVQKWWELHGLV